MKNLITFLILTIALVNFGYAQTKTSQSEALIKQSEAYLEEYEFEKALTVADKALQSIQSARRKSPALLAAVHFL